MKLDIVGIYINFPVTVIATQFMTTSVNRLNGLILVFAIFPKAPRSLVNLNGHLIYEYEREQLFLFIFLPRSGMLSCKTTV